MRKKMCIRDSYNPDKLCWKGVDVEMWKDINKKRIAEDK